MKKYTDLSFAETAQAMEDGKCVQRLVEVSALRSRHWVTSINKSVSIDTRYRLVEEEEPQYRPIKHIVRQFDGSVKEWAAEVGEPVLVRIRTGEYKDYGYTFRAIVDNKYICKDRFGGLVSWDEIAPIKKAVKQLHGDLKEWLAEVGEMVRVRAEGKSNYEPILREYRGTIDGVHYCRTVEYVPSEPWEEIAPIDKKRKPCSFFPGVHLFTNT